MRFQAKWASARWAVSRSRGHGRKACSPCPGRGAALLALLRRAGTHDGHAVLMNGPRLSSAPLRAAQHPWHTAQAPSPQIQFLEEIIALVVDDDEGREILDLDAPDRFHAEFGIFHHLDLLDAVLGEVGRRAADRAEIKAAVLLAG